MRNEDSLMIEEIIALVEASELDIRWRVEPKGEEGGIEECLKYNSYLLSTVKKLVLDLIEFNKVLKLKPPLYIVNTGGISRDDFGIGLGYPNDPVIEKDLNMRSKAKDVVEFANELPSSQRESYLQEFRDAGWKGYL
ncbi:hypothetical protein [Alteromonas lipotrueae]|jgi:hypothetical protein|uniref:hypothetical protein n=1 Tax=Alteromonas lipotrueae TaxID=2803814 RepID=UPI001C493F7F|nr:hypothetical protein [Alteromonas lipotrueae]